MQYLWIRVYWFIPITFWNTPTKIKHLLNNLFATFFTSAPSKISETAANYVNTMYVYVALQSRKHCKLLSVSPFVNVVSHHNTFPGYTDIILEDGLSPPSPLDIRQSPSLSKENLDTILTVWRSKLNRLYKKPPKSEFNNCEFWMTSKKIVY